jgi:bifunctional DNase/RNase
MTHDLLVSVVGSLEGEVERVVVCDLKENTFYATIVLRSAAGSIPVDARPSDAIAIALRTGSPIFVEEAVFESAQQADRGNEPDEMGRLRRWLENLGEEELGKYKM